MDLMTVNAPLWCLDGSVQTSPHLYTTCSGHSGGEASMYSVVTTTEILLVCFQFLACAIRYLLDTFKMYHRSWCSIKEGLRHGRGGSAEVMKAAADETHDRRCLEDKQRRFRPSGADVKHRRSLERLERFICFRSTTFAVVSNCLHTFHTSALSLFNFADHLCGKKNCRILARL